MHSLHTISISLIGCLLSCTLMGLSQASHAETHLADSAIAAPAMDATRHFIPGEVSPSTASSIMSLSINTSSPTQTLPPAPEQLLDLQEHFPNLTPIDLTTSPDDLWQRVRNGFSMPDLDGPLVTERQVWYLNHPETLRRILDRSQRYLYYIVNELEKRGMPTELALLPIVESAYNPMAYSRSHASGLWQFIPSTGKAFHLEQNGWHDQRRDIIASTDAALDYLQTIYDMHGDWHLALASYNCGENAVARAIAKNRIKNLPTDYAYLNLPDETRYYVPKLQALKNIIAHPQLFGIHIDRISNYPYFNIVDKPVDIDVALAAKLAEIPLTEFLALNPSHNRPIISANQNGSLVLPTDKIETFHINLKNHIAQEKPLSNWRTYTLKNGEKLNQVATRFGMTASRIKQLNGITGKTKLGQGYVLLIPSKHAYDPGHPVIPNTSPTSTARQKSKTRPARATQNNPHRKKHKQTQGIPAKRSAAAQKRHAPASTTPTRKKNRLPKKR